LTGSTTSGAKRATLTVVAVVVLIGIALDLMRSPREQWSAALLLLAIDWYQAELSGRMDGAGVRCRFEPTCSHYAEAVIRRDGAALGLWRTAMRLARCGPWTPPGTADPP